MTNTKTIKISQFKAIIERDEDGMYVASVPELPGCYTQAKTLEELRPRIKEVIQLVLDADDVIRKEKIKSPRPVSTFLATEDVQIAYYA